MIFATDLDKTMIFNKKYVNESIIDKVQLVETINQSPVSYMSKSAITKLKELNKKIQIIPTTTRSLEEFYNVKTFEFCKYAIVSNGGIILENNKIMQEWEEHINNILKDYKKDFENIIKLSKKY